MGFRDEIPMASGNGCLQSWSDAAHAHNGVRRSETKSKGFVEDLRVKDF